MSVAFRFSAVEWILIGLVFASCAYFNGGAASNQNARLDAIFAFVEPDRPESGTFRIDRFLLAPERQHNTLDWAYADGHYYANKAPGTILLGAALYAALYWVERGAGVDMRRPMTHLVNAYLINLGVTVLWIALAAAFFHRMMRRSAGGHAAVGLTLSLFLGTGLFPYSTQLWGHCTAAAFLVFALYALDTEPRSSAPAAGSARSPRALWWGGFWLAAATATDYLAGLAAAVIGLAVVLGRPRDAFALAAGAALPTASMLAYHTYCFGNPFALASSLSNPQFLEQRRVLGLFGLFDSQAWLGVLCGLQRGVFVHMPVLWLGLPGMVAWWRRTRHDPWLWAQLATFAGASFVVASFNGWHGGATVCSRYLLPFLPCLLLPARRIRWNRTWTALAIALFTISLTNMLAVAAVNPVAPDNHPNPLYGYTYTALLEGNLAPYEFFVRLLALHPQAQELARWTMWNAGELLGAPGLWSLSPLLALWALVGALLVRVLSKAEVVGEIP